MPIRVQVPGHGIVEFPDGTSEDVMRSALMKLTQPPRRTSREIVEAADQGEQTRTRRNMQSLPAIAGAAGGILGGGIPGAALGGAGGEAIRQLDDLTRGGPPKTPADATVDMAKQGATQGTIQAGGTLVNAGARRAAPWLMQKAAKVSEAVTKEYRTTVPAVIQTLLDEGINVTKAGAEKLTALIGETNAKIATAVQGAPGRIPKADVATRAAETRVQLGQQVNPVSDQAANDAAVSEFMNHPVYKGPDLSVADAHALKVGTYQQLGPKYGELGSATVQTQKALARGAKEEVASKVPSVADLNARDSALMAARDTVAHRAHVAGNSDPVGFAWVAHNPTTFLASLLDRSPAVKSFIARGLWAAAGRASGVAPNVIRGAVAAVAAGSPESDQSDRPAASPDSSTRPRGQ